MKKISHGLGSQMHRMFPMRPGHVENVASGKGTNYRCGCEFVLGHLAILPKPEAVEYSFGAFSSLYTLLYGQDR